MLKEFGLVPSLIAALDDPYVAAARLLGRPGSMGGYPRDAAEGGAEPRHAVLDRCARHHRAAQPKYLEGEYPDAKAALDDAAKQIALSTGLPIAQ